MKTLPALFKRTSTGAIQQWSIGIENSTIITVHGQVGGKMQRTEDLVKEGKNTGRSNETSPAEQALAEATSKWEGKIKKGYVEDIARASAGEKDIDGGFDPMLAHKFVDHGHKIGYPAYTQPKLDGHRCLATIEDGVATLWSRTRKPILSCPHIIEELQKLYPTGSHQKDGELYNHAYKHKFDQLASMIRQMVPAENHTEIQYHMYDNPGAGIFSDRIERLANEVHCFEKKHGALKYLCLVDTVLVNSEEDMIEAFDKFLAMGYEGGMARNAKSLYVGKRSYDLQKIKEFVDDDFPILGIKKGRGGYSECGIFICFSPTVGHPITCGCDVCTFDVKMRGPKKQLMEFLSDPATWKGKILNVKYQKMSSYNIPIFPVGERFV